VRTGIAGTRHPGTGRLTEPIHPSRVAHATSLREHAAALSVTHIRRRATLGIDPKLILVLELDGNVDEGALRAAELLPLAAEQGSLVVAFADDPQLHAFLERVDAFRAAGDDADTAQYQGLIDSIGSLRIYGPQDRLTARVQAAATALADDATLDVHLDLWHPGDADRAAAWMHELEQAVKAANGRLLDRYNNHVSGLLLARAHIPAGALADLAQLDQVAKIDGLPDQGPNNAQARRASVDDLPRVEPPLPDAPIVGLVDSGVRSAHPLLAGAIYDATTLSAELSDGEDEHGHGTRVAGLLLHGSLQDVLSRGSLPRPMFRIFSVRVLGADNQFPHDTVWEAELERAIRHCAAAGARVINVSLGDPDTPYSGPRSTPVAALFDQLSRELGVVIVVPTGNTQPVAYASFDETLPVSYVEQLLASARTPLIDPAPALTALTVGGLATGALAGVGRVTGGATRRALGQQGWPSPISRVGPGINRAIKPELAAPAGSLAWEQAQGSVVEDEELAVLSSGGDAPDRLLDSAVGTSFAAPLAARAAGAVLHRYPDLSANLVRALVLLGSIERADERAFAHLTGAELERARLRTCGYGVPDLGRTIDSGSHRVVLVAEDAIAVDTTMVYEVPIPPSFHSSGGQRGIDVALAFDPPARARRLDYAANRMRFWLVRRMTAEEIEGVFIRADQVELASELEQAEAARAEAGDLETPEQQAGEEAPTEPLKPSSLGTRLVDLTPTTTVRSRGANQLARKVFAQRLREEDGDTFHLVVQCTSLWRANTDTQSFGLAVALWRSEQHPEIYEEIRARVEIPVEIEVRR